MLSESTASKPLTQAPQQEAKEVLARRFPVPRLVDCDYQGSQVRFSLTKTTFPCALSPDPHP